MNSASKTPETCKEARGLSDPWGGTRAGFEAETRINREDFGLTYNSVLETGGVLVGTDVKISLHIEGIKEA